MGAWGAGPFDNDDAADWAIEFEDADRAAGIELLQEAFETADSADYLEAYDGAVAVAAAQVVAWLLHRATVPGPDQNDGADAAAWVRRHPGAPDRSLVDAARNALRRVQGDDSELAELWDDADDEDWDASVETLEETLRRPPS